MTDKRFRVHELGKYNYSEIGEYIDENHTDRPLRNDILVELLNELHEENIELQKTVNKQHKQLKANGMTIMSMKLRINELERIVE